LVGPNDKGKSDRQKKNKRAKKGRLVDYAKCAFLFSASL